MAITNLDYFLPLLLRDFFFNLNFACRIYIAERRFFQASIKTILTEQVGNLLFEISRKYLCCYCIDSNKEKTEGKINETSF